MLTIDQIKSDSPGSVAIGPFGSRMKSDLYTSAGVPVIRGQNISAGRELRGEFVFVSDRTADDLKSCVVYLDDLVFPHRGAIGQVAIVPRGSSDRYMMSTSLMKLTCAPEIANPIFVLYFFRTPRGREELLKRASTVGTPGIGQPLRSLRSIQLPIPPIDEQERIVDVIGALDDKIAVNYRTAQACHQLAELYYRDCACGKPAIPLRALVTPILGGTPDRANTEYWDGAHLWASAKDVAGCDLGTLLTTEEKITDLAIERTKAKPVATGSVILTARGTLGAVARVCQSTSLNQSCYAFTPGALPPAVLYFTIRSAAEQLTRIAQGTVFSTVNMRTFEHIRVAAVADDLLQPLEGRIKDFLNAVEINLRENHALAALRDVLLPRLISGEIRVREAEKTVEDAT
jgi:type I restriction enzyme S subunit